MEPDEANWLAADQEQAFLRCVELAQMAIDGERFKKQDVQDLIHHLGLTNYFKGEHDENR